MMRNMSVVCERLLLFVTSW